MIRGLRSTSTQVFLISRAMDILPPAGRAKYTMSTTVKKLKVMIVTGISMAAGLIPAAPKRPVAMGRENTMLLDR